MVLQKFLKSHNEKICFSWNGCWNRDFPVIVFCLKNERKSEEMYIILDFVDSSANCRNYSEKPLFEYQTNPDINKHCVEQKDNRLVKIWLRVVIWIYSTAEHLSSVAVDIKK